MLRGTEDSLSHRTLVPWPIDCIEIFITESLKGIWIYSAISQNVKELISISRRKTEIEMNILYRQVIEGKRVQISAF